jgi:hypothetical protein
MGGGYDGGEEDGGFSNVGRFEVGARRGKGLFIYFLKLLEDESGLDSTAHPRSIGNTTQKSTRVDRGLQRRYFCGLQSESIPNDSKEIDPPKAIAKSNS